MFKLHNKDTQFPDPLPHINRVKLATATTKAVTYIGDYLIREGIDLYPQYGLQEQACITETDVLWAGSAATAGKTWSGFFKAGASVGVPLFTARLVTLRQKDSESESSYIRDMRDIFTKIGGCNFSVGNGATATWREYNNTIMAIHVNFNVDNPKEWEEFTEYIKANQASYFYWDELTSVKREKTYLYSFSRNRDASGLRIQSYGTFNLKLNHWTYNWLKNAGYVIHEEGDPYPKLNPKMIGVVKYFYVQEQSVEGIIWGDSREEVAKKCNIKVSKEDIEARVTPEMTVKSFTIITGEAAGNRVMVNATQGGSIANLHAAGGKYRDSLKGGYFVDDAEDDKLTVSQKMITNMWEAPQDGTGEMYATLDVSDGAGASGRCVMWIFRGTTAIALKTFEGDPKQLELWIKSVLNEYNVPINHFVFDGGGLGNYLRAYTGGVSIKGQLKTVAEYDEAGNPIIFEAYYNLRSQLLGRIQAMLEKGEISIAVPAEDKFPHGKWNTETPLIEIMKEESNLFITTKKNNKIYYKSKEEFKDRFKYSPDYMDAFWQIAIFHLNTKERKEIEPENELVDFAELYEDDDNEYYIN